MPRKCFYKRPNTCRMCYNIFNCDQEEVSKYLEINPPEYRKNQYDILRFKRGTKNNDK